MIYILGLFRKYITNNNAIHWRPRKYFETCIVLNMR